MSAAVYLDKDPWLGRSYALSILLNGHSIKLPSKFVSLYHRLVQLSDLIQETEILQDGCFYFIFLEENKKQKSFPTLTLGRYQFKSLSNLIQGEELELTVEACMFLI